MKCNQWVEGTIEPHGLPYCRCGGDIPGQWRDVREELPENEKKVFVYFKNELGHGRRTTAEYIRAKTVLAENYLNDEWSDDFGEYDDEKDCYWTPEGWYEQQEITEVNWYLGKDIVTHWMPLPAPPSGKEE